MFKLGVYACLGLFVSWVLLLILQLWFSFADTDLFLKITLTMAGLFIIILASLLVISQYFSEKKMKEYKTVIYQENLLSSLVFGSAKINPVKFSDFLNSHASQGWKVVTMEKDQRRMLLFFVREAYVVILEKERV